jgi:hypothetical protein
LQNDNVLSLVVEFETARVLDLVSGTLFGAIAETLPHQTQGLISAPVLRIDTVGRPEQTNMRLNNPRLRGVADLRDLWNQQDPFALDPQLRPIFRERLIASLNNWDIKDGDAAWTSAGIAASAEVFLDDFLVFDVAKAFSDASFLEIEKSTLNGRAHTTGGGRTVNTNVVDVLLNWLVNRDSGTPLRGGATVATKPGTETFPYLAAPNVAEQSVSQSADVGSSPARVWERVGDFSLRWHPLVAEAVVVGSMIGSIRTLETVDGKVIVERLDALDERRRSYSYTMLSGVPAAHYTGRLSVQPQGSGSRVRWDISYVANGQPNLVVKTIVSALQRTGLDSLQKFFGSLSESP